jgi:hypothetical protein
MTDDRGTDDPAAGNGGTDDQGADLQALVADLHDHLRATGERPVETTASRWIAEAEAVVADVDGGDPPEAVVRKRIGQARDLLAEVEATGDDRADEHVGAARELAAAILDRVGGSAQ